MKIFFLSNDGGGFASEVEIAEGTTTEQLFAQCMPSCDINDYLIRVNHQPARAQVPLTDGAWVSVTPVKIAGAAA